MNEAIFLKGVLGDDPVLERGFPEIAFFGRSNVGKSSLINAVLGKKDLARSSNKPGKTLELNVYEVNRKKLFLDFPGFGYAKTSIEKREKIRSLVIWYLSTRKEKNTISVLVIDSKAGITETDTELLEIATKENIKIIIVCNKIDKLNQKEKALLKKQIDTVVKDLPVHFVSVKDSIGITELKEILI